MHITLDGAGVVKAEYIGKHCDKDAKKMKEKAIAAGAKVTIVAKTDFKEKLPDEPPDEQKKKKKIKISR